MREVAEGVQYIHSEGIVHGDLKGVRVLILHVVNQLISSIRTKSSWTLISTAELLISGLLDILIPLRQEAWFFHHILLLQSCSDSAWNVASTIATNVSRVMS